MSLVALRRPVRSIDASGEVHTHRSIREAAKYHRVSYVMLGRKLKALPSDPVLYHGISFEYLNPGEKPDSSVSDDSFEEAVDLLSSLSRRLKEVPEYLEVQELSTPESEFQHLTDDPLLDIPSIPLMSETGEDMEESEEEEPFSVWLDSPIGSDVD